MLIHAFVISRLDYDVTLHHRVSLLQLSLNPLCIKFPLQWKGSGEISTLISLC